MSVLVLGATGKQGGGVCAACLEAGLEVHALTRKASSKVAERLKAKGANPVAGDFTSKDSLLNALKTSGAAMIYIVTQEKAAMCRKGVYSAEEAMTGKLAVDAAKEAGVSFVVFSSVCGADSCPNDMYNFKAKLEIEQYLKFSGLPHAVLRPTTLFDSFNDPELGGISKGKITGLMANPQRKMFYVSCRDIGKAAAVCFQDPSKYTGRKINCATANLTGLEVAEQLSAVAGSKATYKNVAPGWLMWLGFMPDFGTMHRWWAKTGYPVSEGDLAEFKEMVPDAFGAADYFRSIGLSDAWVGSKM